MASSLQVSQDPDGEVRPGSEVAPNKGGRPRAEIPLKYFKNLCERFCTIEEMADILGVSEATLKRRIRHDPEFNAAYRNARANTKMALRRAQIQMALNGDKTMLIWMGKQLLGQKDRIEAPTVEVELGDERTVTIRWDDAMERKHQELSQYADAIDLDPSEYAEVEAALEEEYAEPATGNTE